MDLDDILLGSSAPLARAGGKFQPKAKPRPRKQPLAGGPSVAKVSDNADAITATSGQSSYQLDGKLSSHDNSTLASADITGSQERSLGKEAKALEAPISVSNLPVSDTEALCSMTAEPLESAPSISNKDHISSSGKAMGENAEIFLGLDSLDYLISQSANTTGAETAHAFSSDNAEDKHVPVPSSTDTSLRQSDAEISCVLFEPSGSCREAATSINDKDIQIVSRALETEGVENFDCLDLPDSVLEVTSSSGKRAGKIPPKPKPRDKQMDAVESVSLLQDALMVQSGPSYDCLLDHESRRLFEEHQPTGAVSEDLHSQDVVCEESRKEKNPGAPEPPLGCQDEAVTSTVDGTTGTERTSRKLRKRKAGHESAVAFDYEGHDNGGLFDEALDEPIADEDENNDDDYQEEVKAKKKRAPRKTKKDTAENVKPVRKRKRKAEAAEQSEKQPEEKFSHSTRRRKRCVDKSLLEMPESEIDYQRLPIRDLIILAEIKERQKKKEAAALGATQADQTDQRRDGTLSEDAPWEYPPNDDNNDEAFAYVQSTGSFGDPSSSVANSSYYNYQSFMKRTPRVTWTEEDTELFYKGVSQFGSDFSMIQQLFPGRSRTQIKLKYKKEERQQPKRLHDALTSKPKDLSHFELLMEKVREQIAKEGKDEQEEWTEEGDSAGITGKEEGPEESAPTTLGGEAKSEWKDEGVIADQGADVPSPAKSHDSEDEDFTWSQYKSEF